MLCGNEYIKYISDERYHRSNFYFCNFYFVDFIYSYFYREQQKLKEMETYKHSLKMKELKIDTRYKNNQNLIEEVHMFLT